MCVGCVHVLHIERALSVAHRNSVMVSKTIIPCPHGYSASCVFGSKQRFESGFSLPLKSVKMHTKLSESVSMLVSKLVLPENLVFLWFNCTKTYTSSFH